MFAMVFQVFFQVFQTHVSSVLSVLFCMLQLLHLDVSKINRMLHMEYAWQTAGDVDPLLGRSFASPTRPGYGMSGAIRSHVWLLWSCVGMGWLGSGTDCGGLEAVDGL